MINKKPVPSDIKLYHIVHMDRLSSIVRNGFLLSDADVQQKKYSGTTIGISSIKDRRLNKGLISYPDLHVGECVPFYFCPRSVMLFMFHRDNHPDISYHGGQKPIIHLTADLKRVTEWASQNKKRWVFTDSNAGSFYFNDYNNLKELNKIDWTAVEAREWKKCREQKQAEFLIEHQLPFDLIESIGVYSEIELNLVEGVMSSLSEKPPVNICKQWYY